MNSMVAYNYMQFMLGIHDFGEYLLPFFQKIVSDKVNLNDGEERITVTFPEGFSAHQIPTVTATVSGSNATANTTVYITNVSNTQVTFEVSNGHVSGTILYHAISTY